jgi:glycine dehydrogenase
VFNTHHSETEMLRYMRSLADKDLALDRSMIPLGSCTMKLNATTEMIPITWPEFARVHPFAPADQLAGLRRARRAAARLAVPGHRLRRRQPAAQCRVAGRVRRAAGDPRLARQPRRGPAQHLPDPGVAHGTNPASAQMAGMQVVVVKCDATATSTSPTCGQVRGSTRTAGRDHDHLPLHLRRVRHPW